MSSIDSSRYCGARKRQGDGNCTRPAGWGTSHPGTGRCKLHGGAAPYSEKYGQLELVERDARRLFGKLAPDIVPVENPLQAYAELAGRVTAWMVTMDTLLDGLDSVGYESERVGEQVRATVQLFERAMDRCNAVLGSYARLRIDERLAAISQQQTDAVIEAINAALNAAGVLDTGARNIARRAAAAHLRLVAGG